MKKVLLLGSQHGDELLGEQLYQHIKTHHRELLPHISYKLANPRAHALQKRYCESDMNRSYGNLSEPPTYEEKQARTIEAYIRSNRFDIVLDLHTTRCIQPPSFLIARLNSDNVSLISASQIIHIAQMEMDMVHSSLIGRCPTAVSIEISVDDIDDTLLEMLSITIKDYLAGVALQTERHLYHVDKLLAKADLTPEAESELVNFALSPGNFYPLLTGNNTYRRNTNYLGFRADKREVIRL